jgi:sec-independent protein translocase protein TatA
MFVANIASPEILIVIGAIIVLFGGSQLPKIARNIGMAGKEFRKAHDEAVRDDPTPSATAQTVPPAPPAVAPAPPVVTPAPAPAPAADDRVTLSRSELEALLDEREARARRQSAP